jgi:hypothetical protein
MVTFLKRVYALFFVLLTVLFFVLMSKIDYIVHATLYQYGLQFSYDWANTYWLTYNLVYFAFGLTLAFAYYVGSQKAMPNKKIAIAIFGSISLLAFCGLQDLLFFVLWAGSLPPDTLVWWWSMWAPVFGTWNSQMQIALTGLGFACVTATWILTFYRKKQYLTGKV